MSKKVEKTLSFEVGKDGVLRTSYSDDLKDLTQKIGGEMTQVCRASNVEWEKIENSPNARWSGGEGWSVRSAHNPKLALRIQSDYIPSGILGDGPYVDKIVCSDREDLMIALFEKREIAVKNELEHFFELIPRKADK